MDAKRFICEFGWEEAERIAKEAGTTREYFSQIAHGHRNASVPLAKRLVAASAGRLTLTGLRPDIYEDA